MKKCIKCKKEHYTLQALKFINNTETIENYKCSCGRVLILTVAQVEEMYKLQDEREAEEAQFYDDHINSDRL